MKRGANGPVGLVGHEVTMVCEFPWQGLGRLAGYCAGVNTIPACRAASALWWEMSLKLGGSVVVALGTQLRHRSLREDNGPRRLPQAEIAIVETHLGPPLLGPLSCRRSSFSPQFSKKPRKRGHWAAHAKSLATAVFPASSLPRSDPAVPGS